MIRVGIVSLGCSKNLVDSEMMLAMFRDGDYKITNHPAEADLIIVNTCGFIGDAKKEAIDKILEMSQYNAKLVATGCFVERNLEELKKAIPEVDAWVPLRSYSHLHEVLSSLLNRHDIVPISPLHRVVSTGNFSAYLRISEGCNNMCSFCAIPYIRGRYLSRPFEEILEEARALKASGIKEISVISQDPMHYGCDFPSHKPDMLDLLKALDEIGFYSIRLLYLYPEEITEEELLFIRDSKSIEPYFDVPVQCASNHLLKLMNRHGTKEEMVALFKRIKALMPKAVLRTTLISGFPGESEEDHEEALAFIKDIRFDHLGDFIYSREEGTAAYSYPNQVPYMRKKRRQKEIMELAQKISMENNQTHIGETMEGLVTSFDANRNRYSFRSYWNAPDDIDGNIYFTSQEHLKPGEIVKVRITDSSVYDLFGEFVSKVEEQKNH